jgi:NADP-dependent 3-hydroxy acid dehydrogenase YdfG
MSELAEMRVLVTGAGSGIGGATARALLAAGADVHATTRDVAAVSGHFSDAERRCGRLHIHALDVRDAEAVGQVVSAAGARGPLSAVICVAGTNIPERALESLTGAGWNEVVETNLTSVFSCVSAALPQLRSTKGHVVVVSSVSAAWPDASGPAYQASKAGVAAFARAAALEEHAGGVRFTTVLPGLVATNLLSKRPDPPSEREVESALQPEDVAATIVFALSLPPRACIAELTVLPTTLQSLGRT